MKEDAFIAVNALIVNVNKMKYNSNNLYDHAPMGNIYYVDFSETDGNMTLIKRLGEGYYLDITPFMYLYKGNYDTLVFRGEVKDMDLFNTLVNFIRKDYYKKPLTIKLNDKIIA